MKKIGHDYLCSFIFFRMFITGLGPSTPTLACSIATSLTTTWGLRRTMQRITVLCNASRLAGVVSGKAGRHIGFTGMHTARRAFSAAQDEALVNTSQASSGLIVDPFVSVKRKPSLFTSPLARIGHIRKQTWKGLSHYTRAPLSKSLTSALLSLLTKPKTYLSSCTRDIKLGITSSFES